MFFMKDRITRGPSWLGAEFARTLVGYWPSLLGAEFAKAEMSRNWHGYYTNSQIYARAVSIATNSRWRTKRQNNLPRRQKSKVFVNLVGNDSRVWCTMEENIICTQKRTENCVGNLPYKIRSKISPFFKDVLLLVRHLLEGCSSRITTLTPSYKYYLIII